MKKYQANIGLLMCALIWGSSFIATDIAYESYTPMQVQVLRFSVSAVILSVYLTLRKDKMSKEAFRAGIILGSVFLIAYTLQSFGMKYTTPSKNAFFTNMNVIFVPLIMYNVFKERISKRFFYGLITILIGYLLIIFTFDIFDFRTSMDSLTTNFSFNIGDLLTMLGAFGFAVQIVLTGIYSKKYPASELLTLQMWISTIGSVILMIIENAPFEFVFRPFMLCMYMAIFSSIFAYGGQIVFQKHTESSPATVLLSLESPFAAIFSILFAREVFFSGLVVGGIFVLTGVLLIESKIGANIFKRKKRNLK